MLLSESAVGALIEKESRGFQAGTLLWYPWYMDMTRSLQLTWYLKDSSESFLCDDTKTIICPIRTEQSWLLGRISIQQSGYAITVFGTPVTTAMKLSIRNRISTIMDQVSKKRGKKMICQAFEIVAQETDDGLGICAILTGIKIGTSGYVMDDGSMDYEPNEISKLRIEAAIALTDRAFDSVDNPDGLEEEVGSDLNAGGSEEKGGSVADEGSGSDEDSFDDDEV